MVYTSVSVNNHTEGNKLIHVKNNAPVFEKVYPYILNLPGSIMPVKLPNFLGYHSCSAKLRVTKGG